MDSNNDDNDIYGDLSDDDHPYSKPLPVPSNSGKYTSNLFCQKSLRSVSQETNGSLNDLNQPLSQPNYTDAPAAKAKNIPLDYFSQLFNNFDFSVVNADEDIKDNPFSLEGFNFNESEENWYENNYSNDNEFIYNYGVENDGNVFESKDTNDNVFESFGKNINKIENNEEIQNSNVNNKSGIGNLIKNENENKKESKDSKANSIKTETESKEEIKNPNANKIESSTKAEIKNKEESKNSNAYSIKTETESKEESKNLTENIIVSSINTNDNKKIKYSENNETTNGEKSVKNDTIQDKNQIKYHIQKEKKYFADFTNRYKSSKNDDEKRDRYPRKVEDDIEDNHGKEIAHKNENKKERMNLAEKEINQVNKIANNIEKTINYTNNHYYNKNSTKNENEGKLTKNSHKIKVNTYGLSKEFVTNFYIMMHNVFPGISLKEIDIELRNLAPTLLCK